MISIRIIFAGILIVSFFTTLILINPFIRKAKKKGFVAKDMYKKDKRSVPTMGGLVILAGIIISLIFAEFFTRLMVPMLVFYFIVFMYALYGLTDDLLGFKKRPEKVWVLFLLAVPIAILTRDTTISFLFFDIELGWIYAFLFAPVYIMVVANLVNMYAGYNGLAGGLTLIMLIFAAVKSYLMNNSYYLYLILPVIGALIAFMYYNFYPSRIFLGNTGSFLIGSALGGFLVLSNIEFYGVIILTPHIINFLLWIYWTRIMHKIPHVKFAQVREDGTIEPPNNLTLKYFVANVFRVNEPQAVLICYGITIFFGVIGFSVT